jgi:hypothetical protein
MKFDSIAYSLSIHSPAANAIKAAALGDRPMQLGDGHDKADGNDRTAREGKQQCDKNAADHGPGIPRPVALLQSPVCRPHLGDGTGQPLPCVGKVLVPCLCRRANRVMGSPHFAAWSIVLSGKIADGTCCSFMIFWMRATMSGCLAARSVFSPMLSARL